MEHPRFIHALILLFGVTCMVTPSQAALITFDEVPLGTALSGQTLKGVQFTESGVGAVAFTLPLGIPFTNGITDPEAVFDGNGGALLRLDFLAPASTLQFDLAIVTAAVPITSPGGTVTLFDAALASIGSFGITGTWNTTLRAFEGHFSYNGATAIGRAVLTVSGQGDNHQGVIDNIAFSSVPEPTSLSLVVAGLLLVVYKKRREPSVH